MNNKDEFKDLSALSKWIISKMFKDNDNSRLGDFCEIYNRYFEESGVVRARIYFWHYVLMTAPHMFINSIFWIISMFKNYLKIAFRNTKKQKTYSVLRLQWLPQPRTGSRAWSF